MNVTMNKQSRFLKKIEDMTLSNNLKWVKRFERYFETFILNKRIILSKTDLYIEIEDKLIKIIDLEKDHIDTLYQHLQETINNVPKEIELFIENILKRK